MAVIGIDVITSNAAEADPSTAQLPELWARFYREAILEQIPRKTPPVLPVAVYTDYETDHTGRYRVIAGAAVEAGTAPPKGLVGVTLPAGRYLVFHSEGAMPDVVIRAWQAVWSHFATPGDDIRAFTADFEQYSGSDRVDIFIALK